MLSIIHSSRRLASRSVMLAILWLCTLTVLAEHRVAEHHIDLHADAHSVSDTCVICQVDASAKSVLGAHVAHPSLVKNTAFQIYFHFSSLGHTQRCVPIRSPPTFS